MAATSPHPKVNPDGTVTGVVGGPGRPAGDHLLWPLHIPPSLLSPGLSGAGRFFLARCTPDDPDSRASDWHIYLRRTLFVVATPTHSDCWWLLLPDCPPSHRPADDIAWAGDPDPGYRWLARQAERTPINLIGPLGNGFILHDQTRNLLLIADLEDTTAWALQLLPLVNPVLDRGGRVTLLLHTTEHPLPAALLDQLPIAVEIRRATNPAEWHDHLDETAIWADQICAGIPAQRHLGLMEQIRTRRFHLEPGFVQVLVQSDLVCGVGACLACVVPLADGRHTRACVHGPVFDLARLVG
jgi:hypothetical protein